MSAAGVLKGQRTLLVEDDEGLRVALRITLENAGCNVIDVVDGEQAYSLLLRYAFDLAVIDMVIPHRPGQEILDLARISGTTLIAISGDPGIEAKDVYLHGAHVLVRKPFNMDDVVQAAVRHLKQIPEGATRVHLSTRELEVLDLIHKGFETQQIAAVLGISPHTVWHHRKSLKKKHRFMSFIEICSIYFNN